MERDEQDDAPEEPVTGLWMSKTVLETQIARNRELLERGLKLREDYAAREKTRETDEEEAWRDCDDRLLSRLYDPKRFALKALGLDPRRSVLFKDFPELLARACDPQCPVSYRPALREFTLTGTLGPAALAISHCPWSGMALPASLADLWFDTVTDLLGTEDWSTEDVRAKLPEKYATEDWWVGEKL